MHGSWICNTGDKWEGSAGKKNSKTLDFYNEASGNLIWLLGGKGNPAPWRKPTDGLGAPSWALAGKGLWNTSKLRLPAAQLSRNTSTFIGQITQFVSCPHNVLTPFLSGSAAWKCSLVTDPAPRVRRPFAAVRTPAGWGGEAVGLLSWGRGVQMCRGVGCPMATGCNQVWYLFSKTRNIAEKKHVGVGLCDPWRSLPAELV